MKLLRKDKMYDSGNMVKDVAKQTIGTATLAWCFCVIVLGVVLMMGVFGDYINSSYTEDAGSVQSLEEICKYKKNIECTVYKGKQ